MKQGRMKEALELVKEWAHDGLVTDYSQVRCYTPNMSPTVFVFELVVENDEARAKYYAELNARPKTTTYWEKWHSLAERSVSNERWTVTEIG
jgi:hypothetical protein